MTCQTTSMSCPLPPADSGRRPMRLTARAARLIRRGWRAYWDWRARKVTVMILHSLDPRTLHDIGVSPSEIEALVRDGNDHRRRYDAAWLWRCGR